MHFPRTLGRPLVPGLQNRVRPENCVFRGLPEVLCTASFTGQLPLVRSQICPWGEFFPERKQTPSSEEQRFLAVPFLPPISTNGSGSQASLLMTRGDKRQEENSRPSRLLRKRGSGGLSISRADRMPSELKQCLGHLGEMQSARARSSGDKVERAEAPGGSQHRAPAPWVQTTAGHSHCPLVAWSLRVTPRTLRSL